MTNKKANKPTESAGKSKTKTETVKPQGDSVKADAKKQLGQDNNASAPRTTGL